MRKFLQSLLKQRCDWLDCFGLVAEELEKLHLLEHRADVEPGEAWVCGGLLVIVKRLLLVAKPEMEFAEGGARPDRFRRIVNLSCSCKSDDRLEIG